VENIAETFFYIVKKLNFSYIHLSGKIKAFLNAKGRKNLSLAISQKI